VKVDIMLNGEKGRCTLIHHRAASRSTPRAGGRDSKMREIISRQMFDVAAGGRSGQASSRAKPSRRCAKKRYWQLAWRDISAETKTLGKAKGGQKRMKQIGSVEVPQEAFLAFAGARLMGTRWARSPR
jgi:GTP-binding protein LepA